MPKHYGPDDAIQPKDTKTEGAGQMRVTDPNEIRLDASGQLDPKLLDQVDLEDLNLIRNLKYIEMGRLKQELAFIQKAIERRRDYPPTQTLFAKSFIQPSSQVLAPPKGRTISLPRRMR